MATIEQFLRTGELGPIQFGMTEDEISEMLGPPIGWGGSSDWPYKSYGALLLTFGRTGIDSKLRLAHIDLYFEPQRGSMPQRVRPSDWMPTAETTESEFTEYLNRLGLAAKRIPRDSVVDLRLATGARIAFLDDRLCAIHYSAPRTPLKQISFTVSADTFAALREQAEKANRSVSALCADWITEKANSPLAGVS